MLVYLLINISSMGQNVSSAKDSIIVVGDVTFWPFEFINTQNKADGIFVEMWNRIGELGGVKVVYKCDNWNDAQQQVFRGEADALGSADKTPKREAILEYVGVLHRLNLHVYYHSNLSGIKDLSSLSTGIKIGLVKGDITVDYVRKNYPEVTIEEFDNYQSLVNAALANELFVFIMEPPAAKYYFINDNKLRLTFRASNEPLFTETLYIAIRKDRPELIRKISKGLSLLTYSEKQKIFKKWNYIQEVSYFEQYQAYAERYSWLNTGVGVLLFYTILISVWTSLYFVSPMLLISAHRAISRSTVFKFSMQGFSVNLPVSKITLLHYFTFTMKVADHWLRKNRENIEKNLNAIKAFKERIIYTPTPLEIESKILDNHDSTKLRDDICKAVRQIFKDDKLVLIRGEGGGGKTSLAINISRWAIESESFLGHLSIPVFIDTDVDTMGYSSGDMKKALFLTIKSNFERLLRKESNKKTEISNEWLSFLIRNQRVIIIMDGLSELSMATRRHLNSYLLEFGNGCVITSRANEEISVSSPTVCISLLRLSGIYLSVFMENILVAKQMRHLFKDEEFYLACKYMAGVSGNRKVTILFAVLFIDVLINQKNANDKPLGVKSIADLTLSYVSNINNKVNDKRLTSEELILILKAVAWYILKKELIPLSVNKAALLEEVTGIDNLREIMDYVVNRLDIINEFDQIIPKYRFALDPVSEYLAALHVIDNLLKSSKTVEIDHIEKNLVTTNSSVDAIIKKNEFLQAFCDCCLSLDPNDLKTVQKIPFARTLIDAYVTSFRN